MYFPYLRGKQYELLALKELSPLLGEHNKILPIIEPVRKPNGSGMDRCFKALSDAGLDFVLVVNPIVGDLRSPLISPVMSEYVRENQESTTWNLGLLLHENTDVRKLISDYRDKFGSDRRLTLIFKGLTDNLNILSAETQDLNRQFIVIDQHLRQRYFRKHFSPFQGVTLRDGFSAEERNSDYLPREESMFSDDHLFYAEEGWYGFSDYLTIGDSFSDGGFTPRAVAIHWTYEPAPDAPIMIRHFTSESNGDTSNVGGKFLEAASKLVQFLNANNIHTRASNIMRMHVENDTYPGLGIVKKLSIQNHLELVSGILSRQ